MKYLTRYIILIFILGATESCQKENPQEEEQPDETIIIEEAKTESVSASSGGTIELESGVILDIPSTSLSSDVSITVEIIDPYLEENNYEVAKEVKGTIISALVRCGPEGTTFDASVQVTIPFYPELFPEYLPEDSIVVVSWSDGVIESHPFTLDQANNVVIAETSHFSDFVILANRDILIDRGRIYNTEVIGDQVWMAENLAYLPEVHGPLDSSITDPRYYVYGFEGSGVEEATSTMNYYTYGVLYNWSAAIEAVPEGWHLPSDEEWKQLELYIGMDPEHVDSGSDARERGPGLCNKLKAKTGWAEIYERAVNGSDDYGFKGLPAGFIDSYNGYTRLGQYTYFWTSSIGEETKHYWTRRLSYWDASIYREWRSSEFGYSVRCVKD